MFVSLYIYTFVFKYVKRTIEKKVTKIKHEKLTF